MPVHSCFTGASKLQITRLVDGFSISASIGIAEPFDNEGSKKQD